MTLLVSDMDSFLSMLPTLRHRPLLPIFKIGPFSKPVLRFGERTNGPRSELSRSEGTLLLLLLFQLTLFLQVVLGLLLLFLISFIFTTAASHSDLLSWYVDCSLYSTVHFTSSRPNIAFLASTAVSSFLSSRSMLEPPGRALYLIPLDLLEFFPCR